MPWLRLDDEMGEHRKVRRAMKASRAAIALHTFGLLHCARYLTDGFVEEAYVDDVCDDARMTPRERRAAIDALEQHDLWSRVDGGWRIHDYLDYNPSRAEVEDKRRRDADRKAKGRQTQAEQRESAGSPQRVHADTTRTPNGRRAVSSGPDPTRIRTAPPIPPAGGGELPPVPTPPEGNRKRDRAAYEHTVDVFAAAVFPDLPDPHRGQLVRAAIGQRHRTVESISAYVRQWMPEGAAA